MKTPLSLATVALGLAGITGQAWAVQAPVSAAPGMSEIGDQELAQMRGRWTPPGSVDTVAYFGVTMSSQWNATSGQQLASSLSVGMSFDPSGAVQMTFQPTVTIVRTAPALPAAAASPDPAHRSVDSSGLANVSGLVQGVQIAGDRNVADNVTSLTVSSGANPSTQPAAGTVYSGQSQTFAVVEGDASATARIDGQGMQVSLDIAGQGQVQQWINGGSLGQVIALGADGQSVHNTLQIQLVQRALTTGVDYSHSVAQSMNLVRGIGIGF